MSSAVDLPNVSENFGAEIRNMFNAAKKTLNVRRFLNFASLKFKEKLAVKRWEVFMLTNTAIIHTAPFYGRKVGNIIFSCNWYMATLRNIQRQIMMLGFNYWRLLI